MGRCARTAAIRAVLLASLWSSAVVAQELSISQVQPNSTRLDPTKGERLQVRFRLNAPAEVKLQLYDGRELLIREVRAPAKLAAGEHVLTWDLRDHAGKPVPPEAYTYVLEAQPQHGVSVRYDLADMTAGETIAARDVKLDQKTGEISYLLDRPARVNVRLGLNEGGPLLRTLIDWVVRPVGQQRESWDGKDASGILELTAHPRLFVSVQAFSLPENSVIVGVPQRDVQLIARPVTPAKERPKAASQPKRMYAHAQQPLQARGDFKVRLTLPASLPRSASGVPVVAATIPVRLEVDAGDRERALARRFEPVFFVDGQFAFENEVGFVPMTWNFDPAALNEGEHYLSVNLRGYEGNFGMAIVKVLVQRDAAATAKQ